jgi:glycosyltransferase involved in cell wall biosynthesis
MRVGFVIYGSLDTLTGGYLYDRKLVEHLAVHGDDVEVVSLPWRNYARHLSDNASRALARRLDGGRFDVLVQDELNHPSLVLTNRRLAGRSACPIVAMVHVLRVDELSGSRLRPLYAAAERRYLGGVDGAIFCCDATRASAEKLVGRPLRGTVAHPCADHLDAAAPEAAIRGRASRGGPLRVVSVANVVPRKGLLVLVDALARLPRDRWQLTVVGSLEMDRAYVRRVRRRVARLGLQDSVRLMGAVANLDVAAHLTDSDVLVVPSSFEGLAIAYLEAMRAGLPVIASTAGGAGEVIDDGSEGWLVAPGDVQTLASRLGRLCEDRELLARMGLAARARAQRHPRWDESLGHVRAFLRTVVAEHRPSGSEVAG